jgi:hypothetical protein
MTDHEVQIIIGIVTVWAIIAGPILALYIQDELNIRREKRGRKLWVFQTLTATRSVRVAPDHVKALNMIDVEFYDGVDSKDREVKRAWNTYRDHLNNGLKDMNDPKFAEEKEVGSKEGNQHIQFVARQSSQGCRLRFRRTPPEKGSYYPQAHEDLENQFSGRSAWSD